MRKLTGIVLCLLLAVGFSLAAAGKQDTGAAGAPAFVGTDPYALPLAKAPVTFKYMVDENTTQYKSKASNLPITAEIQRLTGVTLNIEAVPPANYQTVLTTRLAAATDLPDFMYMRGDVYQYGVDGIIVNLKPYIDKYSTNMEALWAAEPNVEPYFRSPDGNYYGFWSVTSGTDQSDPYGWMIRRDWLEAVKMNPPKSVDEWYAVMKAFRVGDPNGNGNPNDEVPWCAAGLGEQLIWGQAWGLPYRSDGWWLDKSGKVAYAWISPEAKEMFSWLAKCFKEKLLDPEFLTLDHNSRITRNVAGGFCRFANNLATRTQYARQGGAPNAYYMGLPAPSGPNGYPGKMDSYGPTQGDPVSISKVCKDPDLAFRFMDWVWGSKQGTTLIWFGVEGVHWKPNAKGQPNYLGEFFTKNPDGWTSHETALVSIGGHTFFPSVRGMTSFWAYFTDAKVEAATEQIGSGIKAMAPSIKPKFPTPPSTPKEADELAAYWNDIRTYASEQAVKFITGEIGMDKWDEYVATVNRMNLAEVTKIKQSQYDRMMKK